MHGLPCACFVFRLWILYVFHVCPVNVGLLDEYLLCALFLGVYTKCKWETLSIYLNFSDGLLELYFHLLHLKTKVNVLSD